MHTREADDDTERILKEHVPKDHKVRISSRLSRSADIDSLDSYTLLYRFPRFRATAFRPFSKPLHWDHRCDIVLDE